MLWLQAIQAVHGSARLSRKVNTAAAACPRALAAAAAAVRIIQTKAAPAAAEGNKQYT
jgi:hypothetical protein